MNEELQKKLARTYEPSSLQRMRFKGKDLAFKTDQEGNAILLFIGKEDEKGNVKGERYARTLKHDREGRRIKDHWELKGRAG